MVTIGVVPPLKSFYEFFSISFYEFQVIKPEKIVQPADAGFLYFSHKIQDFDASKLWSQQPKTP
jgi:hypothetical protein